MVQLWVCLDTIQGWNLRERLVKKWIAQEDLFFRWSKKKKKTHPLIGFVNPWKSWIRRRLNRKGKIAFMKPTVLPNKKIHAIHGFGARDPCRSHYQKLPKGAKTIGIFTFQEYLMDPSQARILVHLGEITQAHIYQQGLPYQANL